MILKSKNNILAHRVLITVIKDFAGRLIYKVRPRKPTALAVRMKGGLLFSNDCAKIAI